MSDFARLRHFKQMHHGLKRGGDETARGVISPVIQHSGLGAYGGLGDFVSQTSQLFPGIEWVLPLTDRIRAHVGTNISEPLAEIPVNLFEPVTGEQFVFNMEIRAHRAKNNSLSWLIYNEALMNPFERAQTIMASRGDDETAELKRLERYYKRLVNRHGYEQAPQATVDRTVANTPALRGVHPLVRRYLSDPGSMNAIIQGAISKAIVAIISGSGIEYDVVWAHDWHFCGVAGELLLEENKALAGKVCYVQHLHNALHQGIYSPTELARVYGWPSSHLSEKLFRCHGQLNLLGGALNALRFERLNGRAIAVSETHATELPTVERGAGLHHVFEALADVGKLTGINNPVTVPEEIVIRGEGDLETIKPACKADVQARFGLPINPDAFLLLWSHRFTQQKQVGATLKAVKELLEAGHDDLQLIFFCNIFEGSRAEDVESLHDLINRFPDNVATDAFRSEEEMQIAAGVDGALMASYFEPFGYAPVWVGMQGGFIITGANGGQLDIFDRQSTFFMNIQPDIDKPKNAVARDWRAVGQHLLVSRRAYRRKVFSNNAGAIRDGILRAKSAFANEERRRDIRRTTMKRVRQLVQSEDFFSNVRGDVLNAPSEPIRLRKSGMPEKATANVGTWRALIETPNSGFGKVVRGSRTSMRDLTDRP